MPLGKKLALRPGDIVLDGDPASPPKKGHSPPFLAHVYCRQTVAHLSYCTAEHLLDNSPFYPTNPETYALQRFSIGQTAQKCPFQWMHRSLDPSDSASETTSRSVQLTADSLDTCINTRRLQN